MSENKKKDTRTKAELLEAVTELRARLDEAEQAIDAIRTGGVDALVVSGPQGEQIYSLTGAEHVYRVIIEAMNEGALTMDLGGYILFCNQRFCEIVKRPMEEIPGKRFTNFAAPAQQPAIRALVADAQAGPVRRRLVLQAGGAPVSVQLSANLLVAAKPPCICMVVSDLTELEASANSIKVLREQQQALEESKAELARQKEWLQVTMQSIGDAVIATDSEGRISFVNPAAATLTGWTEQEALGQPVPSVFHIIDKTTQQPGKDVVTQALSEGTTVVLTGANTLIARDGREIPVEDSAAPIKDRDGRLLGVVLVFQDSTEKHRRQEALVALKNSLAADLARMVRLHEVSTRLAASDDLSSLLKGIIEASIEITGADMGSIQLIDEAGALRIAAHSGLGRPFLEYFADVRREVHIVCGLAMVDCRRMIVDDVAESPLFRDNPARDVLLKAGVRAFQSTPLIGRSGEIVGMFSTHYRTARRPEEADLRLLDLLARQAADLIERMRATETLNKRSAQLEAANKELESFSYSVSHDLRAPLRAIDGYTRMILRKHASKLDDDAIEKFNVIRDSTRMMGQLIEDLLAFSRTGRAEMSDKTLDIGGLIREVWGEIEAANPDRRLRLKIAELPPCRGDQGLIKQALVNILSNAVKFTKGREEALIEAGWDVKGSERAYYIRDNGVGFDMKYHDKLFGVFQRLHNTGEFEGTGVGLAIVQRIINRHGGRVWAEGEVDRGACFFFSLPG
jgi:PAS domain S-box-containing protein